LKIFPNPTSSTITIEPITKGYLSIFNLSGQRLLQREVIESNILIDVSTIPPGIYMVKVVGEDGVQVRKFIKQ
jgi:hypothetical protein